jgi:hypothetical protein
VDTRLVRRHRGGDLAGVQCAWYHARVLRRFLVKQIRCGADEWAEVDVLMEEQIWAWDSGPFAVRDETGSVLVAPALLDRATGYRVQEDILRPGLRFHVFAVPGDRDGEPTMAGRYQDVWAICADPMPASLARGGRRTRSWALRFGLAGLALFAASALLLMRAGGPPG